MQKNIKDISNTWFSARFSLELDCKMLVFHYVLVWWPRLLKMMLKAATLSVKTSAVYNSNWDSQQKFNDMVINAQPADKKKRKKKKTRLCWVNCSRWHECIINDHSFSLSICKSGCHNVCRLNVRDDPRQHSAAGQSQTNYSTVMHNRPLWHMSLCDVWADWRWLFCSHLHLTSKCG